MWGIDSRVARYTWTVAVVLLVMLVVYLLRRTLFVFILALLLAYLLSPLVDLLDRFLPWTRTHTLALALAYVLFVGGMVLIGTQIGSRVADEAGSMANKLPTMVSGTLDSWANASTGAPGIDSLKRQVAEKLRAGIGDAISALPQVGLKFLTLASYLIYVVIIPILAFFFLKDARTIRDHILSLVEDGPRRDFLNDLIADINLLLAHYMRALVVLSLSVFTAYAIFFSVMGVPYAVLLAALAGMLEFIPMLGPATAAAMILIVAGVTGAHVLAILIFIAAYRIFQDYMLSPHLMGQGVEIHPLAVLFGVFAGAEIAGIPGTVLSVPVLALTRIFYLRIRRARLRTHLAPENTITP